MVRPVSLTCGAAGQSGQSVGEMVVGDGVGDILGVVTVITLLRVTPTALDPYQYLS